MNQSCFSDIPGPTRTYHTQDEEDYNDQVASAEIDEDDISNNILELDRPSILTTSTANRGLHENKIGNHVPTDPPMNSSFHSTPSLLTFFILLLRI